MAWKVSPRVLLPGVPGRSAAHRLSSRCGIDRAGGTPPVCIRLYEAPPTAGVGAGFETAEEPAGAPAEERRRARTRLRATRRTRLPPVRFVFDPACAGSP